MLALLTPQLRVDVPGALPPRPLETRASGRWCSAGLGARGRGGCLRPRLTWPSSVGTGVLGRPHPLPSSPAEPVLPGVCRELIGSSLAALPPSPDEESSVADSLLQALFTVRSGLCALARAHEDQDEDSADERKRPAACHLPCLSPPLPVTSPACHLPASVTFPPPVPLSPPATSSSRPPPAPVFEGRSPRRVPDRELWAGVPAGAPSDSPSPHSVLGPRSPGVRRAGHMCLRAACGTGRALAGRGPPGRQLRRACGRAETRGSEAGRPPAAVPAGKVTPGGRSRAGPCSVHWASPAASSPHVGRWGFQRVVALQSGHRSTASCVQPQESCRLHTFLGPHNSPERGLMLSPPYRRGRGGTGREWPTQRPVTTKGQRWD